MIPQLQLLSQAFVELESREELTSDGALSSEGLSVLTEIMLAALDAQRKRKITMISSEVESAASKYSDSTKSKKINLLLSESHTTQSDSKIEDVLARLKTKSRLEYGSVGLVSPPFTKSIPSVPISSKYVDELVKDVMPSKFQATDNFAAAAEVTLLACPVGINCDGEKEASDQQEDDGML